MFAFLSLDEVAMLHEQIGHAWGPRSVRTGMWVVICLPIFLVALIIVARGIWPLLRDHPSALWRFAIGLALFLASAVGVELLANLYPDGSLAVHICVLIEETGEMLAHTILLWGAVDWAQQRGIRLSIAR
jgi:hypothetical protein